MKHKFSAMQIFSQTFFKKPTIEDKNKISFFNLIKKEKNSHLTITKYFFTQNLRIFGLVFFALMIFFSLSVIIAASSFITKYKISYNYVIRYTFLLLIKDVDKIIPFSALVSTWIFVSSIRSQIAVINCFGISNFKITKLVMLCYTPIFILLVYFCTYVRPESKRWIANLTHEIQKISVVKILKEKEVISNDGFDIYIERLNKQTMNMEDIIIRLYNNCETTFITSKKGFVEENAEISSVYLVLKNAKILSLGNKESCNKQNNEKHKITKQKPYIIKKSTNITEYKIELNAETLTLNLFTKETTKMQYSRLNFASTKRIVSHFYKNFPRFHLIVYIEIFHRFISPFFLYIFIMTILCFLLPKSYIRQQSLFSLAYFEFFSAVIFAIILYGFFCESLIEITKTISTSIIAMFLMSLYLVKKVK